MASRKNRDAKSVSISGAAYTVAVGGAPRGYKPKTTNYQNPKYADISPRYLKPTMASCHDKCKHRMRQESLELEKHAKTSRSRKTSSAVKITKTKTKTKKPISFQQPKIRAPQIGQRKIKSIKIDNKYKATRSGLSPRMTKNKLKKLVAKKNQEMTKTTLDEGETAELEFATPTLATEITDFTNSESSQSPEKQASNSESEEINNDYEMEASEGKYEVEMCKDEEDEGIKVKFKQGTVVELENSKIPTWLKFNRGTVLEKEEETEEEKVTLKHQEQIKKEAKDLLNRVIEETASKLAEDKKTKVGALVGAFETVISLQEDNTDSP